jgi:hypothetical protein
MSSSGRARPGRPDSRRAPLVVDVRTPPQLADSPGGQSSATNPMWPTPEAR